MKNSLFSDEDYNLWRLIGQTRWLMLKARTMELSRFNISPMQVAVLFAVLVIDEKATPIEISRFLFREPHSVSELVSRMEKDGLVRKVKDLDNKGQVRVVLTEKGHETYSRSSNRESIHEIMSCLSEEERQQLKSCLLKLRDKALKQMALEREKLFLHL